MTGNDIVDIATARVESNWKRPGFLQKIFTQQEQQYIHNAQIPDQVVWRLWSMKESAYKIYSRQYDGRFFAPHKLSCNLLNDATGLVTIENTTYHTITGSTKNYIYTIAGNEPPKSDLINDCFEIPQHYNAQQEFIYKKLVASYAVINAEDKNNLTILKNEKNAPFLYCKKEKISIPVSITHHGNYAAFTIN